MRAPFRVVALAVVLAAPAFGGCTETPLSSSDPEAPGATAPTLQFILLPEDLPLWRDTTFVGFAVPGDASFLLLSDRTALRARILGRFPIPDTIRTFADTLPAERFDSASVRFAFDTVRSEFTFPATVRLFALQRSFEEGEATWETAREGEPWATPGGDLGAQLAAGVVDSLTDSLVVSFDVPVDSLLKAWRETDGEPGFAVVLEGSEARIRVRQVLLRFEAVLEGREEPVSQSLVAEPLTFVYDPSQPEPERALRVGGIPAARTYLVFLPPDSLDGVSIRDGIVNHAELFFEPRPPPPDPFALDESVAGRPVELLADPFDLGRRTPIGRTSVAPVVLKPDSLRDGRRIGVDVTPLVQAFAAASPDSAEVIRIGIRLEPDGSAFGFWEFFSEAEADPALRPRLLVVFTPRPEFRVP